MSPYRKANLVLGVAMILVGGIQIQIPLYQEWLTPAWQGILTSSVGSIMLALHFLSDEMRNDEEAAKQAALAVLKAPTPSDKGSTVP